ncbi:MAG: ACT domain-containing protein [Ignavibacteria bacterium]|nr:ACT domain-containing protein [Ignavibacteria bacterium]
MNLSESKIREITIQAIKELGEDATPEMIRQVVYKSVEKLSDSEKIQDTSKDSGRIIITAFGINRPGVVSTISNVLAEAECDIMDITQKLLQEFFTMIMIVDISNSPKSFKEIHDLLSQAAEQIPCRIMVQHEDVFRFMHRI